MTRISVAVHRVGQDGLREAEDALDIEVFDDGILQRGLGDHEVLLQPIALAVVGARVERLVREQSRETFELARTVETRCCNRSRSSRARAVRFSHASRTTALNRRMYSGRG